jgi:hypothetical protein
MTDTSVIAALRPEIKIKDPTGPLRSRRARQKRKAKTTVSTTPNTGLSGIEKFSNEIKVSDTVSTPGSSAAEPHRIPWSAWPLAVTTIALMGVSLTHLSDGVTQLTAIPSWQAWAMAVGIDCMLISTALAQLTAPADVKKDIALVAHCMEAGTLVMSAGLNALAFTGGAFDAAHWAQVAFGCFVPAAISGATYILARLTRR